METNHGLAVQPAVPYPRHEHTAHGNAGAGMDVCIIFSMWVGSVVAFGISAIAHAMLIAGIFITAGVFETAKRRPQYFGGLGRGNGGEHE